MPHTLFPTLSSSDYVLCMCNFDKRPMKNHPSQLVFHETCAWFPFVNHSITRCGVHILLRHRMGRNSDKTDNSITNSDEKVELLLAKVALERHQQHQHVGIHLTCKRKPHMCLTNGYLFALFSMHVKASIRLLEIYLGPLEANNNGKKW